MIRRMFSLLLISMAGFYLYENRYRVMNGILGIPIMRKVAVSSFMSVPFIRSKMVNSVFTGPSEWK